MIRFEEGNNCFNYRVVGVAIHENSVLLHQGEGEDFWTFPGGRAEFGETAEQTLKREMQEEIGVEVEVVRLLWFVENFFQLCRSALPRNCLLFSDALSNYVSISHPARTISRRGGGDETDLSMVSATAGSIIQPAAVPLLSASGASTVT